MEFRGLHPVLLPALMLGATIIGCGDDTQAPVVALRDTIVAEDIVHEVATRVGRVTRQSEDRAPYVSGVQPARSRGRRLALVAPSPSSVEYDMQVPLGGVLRVGTAVATDATSGKHTERLAVRFRVRVNGEILWERVWDSDRKGRHQRHWFDDEVDLARYGGHDVVVTLEAESLAGNTGVGQPAWSRVQLVRRARVSRQEASLDAPNVLLLVVDTLRSDRLGSYGASPTRTPNTDALAATGTVFRRTWAQAPWTLPSVTTILTGRYPRAHGVVGRSADFGRPAGLATDEGNWAYLADTIPTIASLARRAGVSTVGVTSNLLISRENNLARGFETFVELPVSPMPVQWARATAVHGAFSQWLAVNNQYRFFAYLHYMEPHDPYVPAPGARARCPQGAPAEVCDGVVRNLARARERERIPLDQPTLRYLESLYDGEVRDWDSRLPGLLELLDRYGLRERTLIVLTADHGEEFAEHGHLGHRKQLYTESLAVPLILAGPGVPSGIRDDLAELVDILPTVVRILGAGESNTDFPGYDLLRGATPRTRTFAETRYGVLEGHQDGNLELLGVREGRWAYVRAPAAPDELLHDVNTDPGETMDIASAHPGVCSELRATLDEWVARTGEAAAPTRQGEPLTDKLRALGYVE